MRKTFCRPECHHFAWPPGIKVWSFKPMETPHDMDIIWTSQVKLWSARLRKYWSRWRKTSSSMERGPRARNSDITHIHPISGASLGPENRAKTLFIALDTHRFYFCRNTENWFSIWKRRWSNPLSPRPCVSDSILWQIGCMCSIHQAWARLPKLYRLCMLDRLCAIGLALSA